MRVAFRCYVRTIWRLLCAPRTLPFHFAFTGRNEVADTLCLCAPLFAVFADPWNLEHLKIDRIVMFGSENLQEGRTDTENSHIPEIRLLLRGLVETSITSRMASSGILRRAALVRTDVSEELRASFIRVTRIGELGTTLACT
jgi:hypothetical protein